MNFKINLNSKKVHSVCSNSTNVCNFQLCINAFSFFSQINHHCFSSFIAAKAKKLLYLSILSDRFLLLVLKCGDLVSSKTSLHLNVFN